MRILQHGGARHASHSSFRLKYYDMFVVGGPNIYQYFVCDENDNLERDVVTAEICSSSCFIVKNRKGKRKWIWKIE